jgi:methylenetetrahydrofolate dehydrogenase (NADP+)/methenyltetrahydrofolate cyclohydrolase
MSAKILDGKAIGQTILNKVATEIKRRKTANLPTPILAVILVGNDAASAIYVKNKLLACKQVGITCNLFKLNANVTQKKLLALIHDLNTDPNTNAILVQLPLPSSINLETVLAKINPAKDVDGFNPYNVGLTAHGWPTLQACTPMGILKLLKHTKVTLRGKNAVIIGSSNIVGKPMALCLINAGCTVTICNKHTTSLADLVSKADILISATGQPHLITGDWIKPNSIVIDVGIKKVNNQIVGDIDFKTAKQKAKWITKVPGGVGPMTIACLIENTLLTQKLQLNK